MTFHVKSSRGTLIHAKRDEDQASENQIQQQLDVVKYSSRSFFPIDE